MGNFQDDDIDQMVRIWDESRLTDMKPVYRHAEVLAAAHDGGLAVVAAHGARWSERRSRGSPPTGRGCCSSRWQLTSAAADWAAQAGRAG